MPSFYYDRLCYCQSVHSAAVMITMSSKRHPVPIELGFIGLELIKPKLRSPLDGSAPARAHDAPRWAASPVPIEWAAS